jgi:hypothetical protein
MNYHLICGYKRSGKDTFYKKIVNLKNKDSKKESDPVLDPSECQESETSFYILGKEKMLLGSVEPLFYSSKKGLMRMAMADMVKEEINEYFKISFKTKECEELAKDNLNFYDEETKVYRSLRSYYIEHAMKMRAINPDHWCNRAYMKMLLDEESDFDVDYVITDWRFKNEKIFFDKNAYSPSNCITYRIFRKETDDENFFDESEHSLDNELTDFLVVGSESDIEFAKKKFTQYHDYKLIMKI